MYNGEEVFTQANKNLGNRFIYGGSLQGKLMLSDPFEISGGITFTTADQNDDYGPMPSIAPLFGTFMLSHEIKNWKNLLIWKFSDRKLPAEYSWGGEDGLNETPLVNPDATEDIKQILRYAFLEYMVYYVPISVPKIHHFECWAEKYF